MSSLLHIMHYPCFHYYIVIHIITITAHCYMLPLAMGQLADDIQLIPATPEKSKYLWITKVNVKFSFENF